MYSQSGLLAPYAISKQETAKQALKPTESVLFTLGYQLLLLHSYPGYLLCVTESFAIIT